MNKISTLNGSGYKEVYLYKTSQSDGVRAKFSHGRMDWYLADTREYIDIYWYTYWKPA